MKEQETVTKRRRWLGVILSLFVPGFGLARAGMPKRAALWFFGLPIASLAAGILLAFEEIPFSIGAVAVAVSFLLYITMLCDSFRSGIMTRRLWFAYFGVFILLFLLPPPLSMVIKTFTIPTGSMAPTLMGADSTTGSDYVVVDRLSYFFGSPERGDLVVFKKLEISGIQNFQSNNQNEIFYVMRLIGFPGENITISDNSIFVDEVMLGEDDGIPSSNSYVTAAEIRALEAKPEANFKVGSNEFFVLGDNSQNSFDSRFWGGVPQTSIIGKVTTIYYPFSRIGRISPPKQNSSNQSR
jgi:signal peptidase I